jgi:hypothetical protein
MTSLQAIEQELLITLYGLDNLRRTLPHYEWKTFCIPNTLHRTYMEAFMHWFLMYRSDVEVIDLFSTLDPDQIEKFTFTTDPLRNIAFALVKKRR